MISLKNYTHYSLTKAISHPDVLLERHKELGYTHVAITDYNSISGAITSIKEAKKLGLQCIVGTTLSIKFEITKGDKGSLLLLAYSLEGWQSLIRVISAANSKENHDEHPQISLAELSQLELKGLICIVGSVDSLLSSRLFNNIDAVYKAELPEDVKTFINKAWVDDCDSLIDRLQQIFGFGNLYLESCLEEIPADQICNQAVRFLGKKLKIPVVPVIGSHYINQEDWKDHHILICSGLKTTLKSVREKLEEPTNLWLKRFFASANYYVRTLDSFPQNEIDNLNTLEKRFESYNVFSNPKLPKFQCPDGKTAEQYTRELCRDGWKVRQASIMQNKLEDYKSRVEHELKTYAEIGILDYFLIVADFLAEAKQRGEYVGLGRGSAGGCSIAYFLGITEIDPVKYGLSSSRFYNAGRNTKDKKTYPDIDCDLMVEKRELSIQYLQNKYGKERLGQVVTFGRLQGRGALREVLRINDACTFEEINKITNPIPDEAKIAGELQEMEEAGEEKSIILWALRNKKNELKDWCYLDDDDRCQGEYAKLFEQAIRLEGTLKTQGRHAAAIILGSENLNTLCPMLFNKSKEDPICGFEYTSLEEMGLVKFDLLGVSVLDKLVNITNLIRERYGKQ